MTQSQAIDRKTLDFARQGPRQSQPESIAVAKLALKVLKTHRNLLDTYDPKHRRHLPSWIPYRPGSYRHLQCEACMACIYQRGYLHIHRSCPWGLADLEF